MTNKQWAIWQMIEMDEHDMARFIVRISDCDFDPQRAAPLRQEKCEEWLKQEHKEKGND